MLVVGSEADLGAEKVRVIRRAAGTAQHAQEREIVEVTQLSWGHTDPTPHVEAHQAGADCVLNRQPQAEVGCHCQNPDDLSDPAHAPILAHRAYAATLTLS